MAYGDQYYFEKRAHEEFQLAKSTHDRCARSIHLKFAKCYHDLARGVRARERIRAVAKPGREH